MKSLLVLALLALAAGALAASGVRDRDLLREEWLAFKLQHRKLYASAAEERARRQTFRRSRLLVARHNQRYALRLETSRLALNEFADMSPDEFARFYTGFRPRRSSALQREAWGPYARSANASVPPPDHMDWRAKGAVTAVKKQGTCGSCWAFVATGAIESQRFVKTKVLESLSEQNLVDCSRGYGNGGCGGGNTDDGFMYVHDHGIAAEASYPYEAVDGACRINRIWNRKALRPGTVIGFLDIHPPTEEMLKYAVSEGPVAAGIVVTDSFRLYDGGVVYPKNCSGVVSHAVLVVGYGTDEAGGDYWLVKNSWGPNWGEGGYARMARNRNNNCDIASYTSVPILDINKGTHEMGPFIVNI